MLENQLPLQESQNAIAQGLQELQNRHEKQEEKIELLEKTVHNLERRIQDLSGSMVCTNEDQDLQVRASTMHIDPAILWPKCM